ncbi:hypothetical protein GO755_03145 [Spirosoma sp. HMF4905]|uniref:Uncharacterized protein n=1 Tax=Spirosoma arboris TaxID=2682092 RepID=A0A7K1S5T7_9BACT|nr:hypothetical protein [Spirosoma arboris]MVM29016.1 hypothetical protein [Spirosoma arboris]
MFDTPHLNFHFAVRQLCGLPDAADAIDITTAFVNVRREMHYLLDSVEEDDVIPYQPAGRLIEQICQTELVAYLRGDRSALSLSRLRDKVQEAERLLP